MPGKENTDDFLTTCASTTFQSRSTRGVKVFRIYRDVRFQGQSSPTKPILGLHLQGETLFKRLVITTQLNWA